MKTAEIVKNDLYKKHLFYFKYLMVFFIICLISFMLLRFPETAGQGISDGIDICLGTLIPSLYPFMIVSSLIINLNLFSFFEKCFSKAAEFIFGLPGKCLGVILMSLIGGFPIGGKMTKDLYEKGEISSCQGQRLLMFCVNPGPAFAISSVGFYMLGSKKIGLIIYLSLIVSSLIVGILTRFIVDDEDSYFTEKFPESSHRFSDSFVKSVSGGSSSMLSVCAWVISFSCINRLIEITPLSNSFKFFSYCILEVTNGCLVSSGNLPIPIIAGIIGFGGFCTHFQIMSAINTLKLKYKYFFASRIFCGALAVIICNFALKLFPVSYDVFSLGTLPQKVSTGESAAVSIGMLTLCGIFLIGDSFYIKIKKKTKQQTGRSN